MNIPRVLVTGFLVFVFGAAGLVKLTDRISPQVHSHMKNEFVQFAKVCPLQLLLGYKVEPYLYMRVIGVVELLGALLLCLGPQPMQMFASFVLAVVMVGALQTLFWLNTPPQMMVPALVCLILLLCNMSLLQKDTVRVKAE